MKSSIACSVVGSVIILLLILSIFIYMEAPSAATIFGIIVAVLVSSESHLQYLSRLCNRDFISLVLLMVVVDCYAEY